MKRHGFLSCLGRAAGFLLILALCLGVLSTAFRPKDNTEEAGMHFLSAHGYLGQPQDSIDVFFLGDSMAYSSYIPMELWRQQGISSYVAAEGGGAMNVGYDLLREIVQYQHPRLVVLEAHMLARKTDINDALLSEAARLFSIFQDHDGWKTLSPSSLFAPVSYTYTDHHLGYWLNPATRAADPTGYMAPSDDKIDLSPVNRFYFQRFVRLCREEGISLLIVGSPSTENWNMEKHNAVADLADACQVPFLDLGLIEDQVGIDWETDSQDGGDHMNYRGAVKVTTYLGEYLTGHYDLPDHREDEAYQQWWDILEAFEQEVAQRQK
ncbi:MAG: hypothetical protein ACI3VN_08275 [Candidatus Onthomonas sp.]